jgi:sulfate adenylyltransferase subunit 2
VFSFRDAFGQWNPKNQRPELWNLYNGRIEEHQNIRVFPLSNWTEADIWNYIDRENIPVVPLYFAKERDVLVRGSLIIPLEHEYKLQPGEKPQKVMCRMRSLGCTYCTGAILSEADTVPKIVAELKQFRRSERENRIIDYDQEASMELKKREGYF